MILLSVFILKSQLSSQQTNMFAVNPTVYNINLYCLFGLEIRLDAVLNPLKRSNHRWDIILRA